MKKGLSDFSENPARGASRVRTGDPLLAKQMRYQLRYSPERSNDRVGSGGLEPPTSSLSGMRSNQLSYEPIACNRRYITTKEKINSKRAIRQENNLRKSIIFQSAGETLK